MMEISYLKKYLGRLLNDKELSFINAMKKSYNVQNLYNSELKIIKNYSNTSTSSFLIATSKDDKRGIIGQNIIDSLGLKQIEILSDQNKKLYFGLERKKEEKQNPNLGFIFFIKRRYSKTLIKKIIRTKLIISTSPVHKKGLGFSIYKLLKENNCGLLMNIKSFSILYQKSINGLLLQVDNKSIEKFESLILSNNIKSYKLGKLQRERVIKNDSKLNELVTLPMKIIDLALNQNKVFDQDIMHQPNVNYIQPKLKKKINFNMDLKKILNDISNIKSINLFNVKKESYGYSTHDIDYIKYDDYFMNAMALISNASRKLICNGIIPECGTGYISINKSNNSIKNSFLKGISLAVKYLNINMDYSVFIPSKSSLLGSFYVLGKKVINTHIDKEFNHSDHFISMLGTHTGELGGSKYLSIYNNEDLSNRPTVDLLTEQRLQNLIISAFQRNLIQTASPVGEGGIAPTLVRLLSKSKNLGARISFSSKLSTPQILFGETQSIAIVSIKEADIMNLERLCMSSGIPNTTIGRVTNDGIFSFNENIKIKVKDLFK